MKLDHGVLHLEAAFKRYPHTAPLMDGVLVAPGVALDCQDVDPIHRAFAPMARRQAYDISEMAIVTFLQAKCYGKPLIMLPTVLAARLQQKCIVFNKDRGPMTVHDLAGKRVGVRAYTQTTGMWVRAILDDTYGLPADRMQWVTFEGGHLEEYADPAFVTRAPAGKEMLQMLLDGELDAAIFGNDLPDLPQIGHVIADHVQADQRWLAQHGYVPYNHVAVVRSEVAQACPEAVREVFGLMRQAKGALPDGRSVRQRVPDGADALRGPLDEIIRFCERQQLLPRKLDADEVLADSLALLGELAR